MRLQAIGLIITLTVGLVAAPLMTNAKKPGKVYRIGWLTAKKSDGVNKAPWFKALMEELRDRGARMRTWLHFAR